MTDLLNSAATVEYRDCKACIGAGKAHKWDFETEAKPCYTCRGAGKMPAPDTQAILAAIKGRKGLCSKRPASPRAYFVWRLARFHGGADVTMPMGAEMEVHGDPWVRELDALADAVAKRVYGTNLAAAARWGRVLGYIPADLDIPGLPATAYEGGPVLGFGATKPDDERHELDPAADEVEEADDIEIVLRGIDANVNRLDHP